GELLAVVLWPPMNDHQLAALNGGGRASLTAPSSIPESIERYVTRWGMDPIWNSTPTSLVPTAHHFPGATFGTNLTLPELEPAGTIAEDNLVSVAAYEPQYCAEEQAWYVDIDVRPIPTYWTFVRFAFARYQPQSLRGVELS